MNLKAPRIRMVALLGVATLLLGSLAVSLPQAVDAAPVSRSLSLETVAASMPFTVRGSAEQVDVTGLDDGETVTLLAADGSTVATEKADSLGGALFRNVTPGAGYTVKRADGTVSPAVTVHSTASAPWDSSIYDQTINNQGYQYLTTRDGTKLAIDVHLPSELLGPLVGAGGPFADLLNKLPIGGYPTGPNGTMQFPTVIEYAGYGYANPDGPQNGIAKVLEAMGFAVVDVNMRGTGCSGGAYDFFEPLQNLDGYDVIETIAHQPWVMHGKVGMIGISYGGISQLFTAQTQPPDLAAIAPLSVLDATATTLYPGGILNTGFALSWAKERVHDALPASATGGQAYALKRIQNGDQTCAQNQVLHGEAVNLLQKVKANAHYVPATADPLDPVTFVDKINVPVFMACQWEDEQTGGHCPALVQHMTGTSHKWFTFTNGAHIDSLDPATFNRWFDFLDLYVKQMAPATDLFTQLVHIPFISSLVYHTAMGVPNDATITLPPDPIQDVAKNPDYQTALTSFEKLPAVRVLFDNGAGKAPNGGTDAPGNPYPAFEQSFSTLPIPGVQARSWYLGDGGTLTADPPQQKGIDWYTSDATALPLTNYTGNTGSGGLWGNASQWTWNWKQNPQGTAVSYVSAPLSSDTTIIGAGAVQLWVKSSTPDVDLQATISEIRPDGKETFVQDGWLRASERKLSTDASNMFKIPGTLLAPIPEFTSAAAAPMPADQFVPVTIPLYYQGHVYRAGSRLRVTIAAPNGAQPVWSFAQTEPAGTTAKVSIAHSPTMPARVVLPVVPGVSVPTGLPACPSLRNEPCRPYKALTNNSLTPKTPPTTTPTTTPPTTNPPATNPPGTNPPGGQGQPGPQQPNKLAFTGANLSWQAWLGFGVVALGAALVLLARRRVRSSASAGSR